MLELRELARGDLAAVKAWRADRDTVACLGAPFRYIGPEVDEAWFDSYMRGRANCVRCVVVDADDPAIPLGLATLASINWVHRTCTFHIQVSPEARGHGVGGFALDGMLRHAFRDLGLNRVELDVLETNVRARRMYERAGFMVEGTRRQAAFKDGAYVDMVQMGLLREEWESRTVASGGLLSKALPLVAPLRRAA